MRYTFLTSNINKNDYLTIAHHEVKIMKNMDESKKNKPQIEDVINEVLSDNNKSNALDFIEYLRTNKLTPNYASANSWKVNFKGQGICYIRLFGTAPYHRIEDGSWHINFLNFSDEFYSLIMTDELKEVIWKNIKFCFGCSNCAPGQTGSILERKFNNICHHWFVINNPNILTLDFVKKILIHSIS